MNSDDLFKTFSIKLPTDKLFDKALNLLEIEGCKPLDKSFSERLLTFKHEYSRGEALDVLKAGGIFSFEIGE